MNRWKRMRILIPLILLGMILARMVWLQLRDYSPTVDIRTLASVWYLEVFVEKECTFPPYDGRGKTDGAYDLGIWLSSTGVTAMSRVACALGTLTPTQFLRLNQWLLVFSVLFVTLMVRFLTSNWVISLAIGAMLLSRGKMLANLGMIGIDAWMILFMSAWFAAAAHYIRTASRFAIVSMIVTGMLGSLFDHVFASVFLVIPILLSGVALFRKKLAHMILPSLRAINRKMRHMVSISNSSRMDLGVFSQLLGLFRQSMGIDFEPKPYKQEQQVAWTPSYEKGTAIRVINVPFLIWILWNRRWVKTAALFAGLSLLSMVLCFAGYLTMVDFASQATTIAQLQWQVAPAIGSWLETWGRYQLIPMDLHLTGSLLLVAICCVQSPAAGLSGFFEGAWLLLATILMLFVVVCAFDYLDLGLISGAPSDTRRWALAGFRPRIVLLWVEPVILGLGAAGLYNIMKVFDTKLSDRS